VQGSEHESKQESAQELEHEMKELKKEDSRRQEFESRFTEKTQELESVKCMQGEVESRLAEKTQENRREEVESRLAEKAQELETEKNMREEVESRLAEKATELETEKNMREEVESRFADERKKLETEKNMREEVESQLADMMNSMRRQRQEFETEKNRQEKAESQLRDLMKGRETVHFDGRRKSVEEHLGRWRSCPYYLAAEEVLNTLQIDKVHFERRYDRCYCPQCYKAHYPDVAKNDGPNYYVVPRGWARFGLRVPPQALSQDVFNKYCASFHGTSAQVATAIVKIGDFLFPGDKLPDGNVLRSSKCAGRQDEGIYTSQTINYAGLKFYAQPAEGPSGRMYQVVLQCRQKPGSFKIQGETMKFRKNGQFDLCPHVDCEKIEWFTDRRKTLWAHGILIRTFPKDEPPNKYFRSPVD